MYDQRDLSFVRDPYGVADERRLPIDDKVGMVNLEPCRGFTTGLGGAVGMRGRVRKGWPG